MSKKYYWLLAAFSIVYLASFFVEVPNPEVLAKYNIPLSAVLLINMTAALPMIGIWFAGFYGFINLYSYSDKIRKSADGDAIRYLAHGLAVLVIGLSFGAILSRWLLNAANAHMIDRTVSTIVSTHWGVIYPVIAFVLILIGARKLVGTVKKAEIATTRKVLTATVVVLVGALAVFLTFASPNAEHAVSNVEAAYLIPDWLRMLTVTLPYLVMLVCGALATLLISAYYCNVGGKLYKKALKKLNRGFILVVVALTFIQFIVSLSSMITAWGLASLLILIYVLLISLAAGFIMVARGAKGLARLEEVE